MKARYRRMLAGMSKSAAPQPREWGVYLVRCSDGTLYTGVAKDVAARVAAHNAGRGAAYTRTRRPVELVCSQTSFTRSEALIREAFIKRQPKERKEEILSRNLSRA